MTILASGKRGALLVTMVGFYCIVATPSAFSGTVGTPSTVSHSIPAGIETTITVTSVITDPSVISGSVQLQEIDSSGAVVAVPGLLHDDGLDGDAKANDKIWTIRTTIREDSPGPVIFRVSAAFKGSLVRSYSNSTVISVVGAASVGAGSTRIARPINLTSRARPSAQPANTTILDYEGFSDGTSLTTQYPGIVFSNAVIRQSGVSLNEFEFPPHSGLNVVSDSGGPMSIAFIVPVASVSGYFTYSVPVTINAYDGNHVLVATASSQFSNNEALSGVTGSSPNELIQVNDVAGIASVTITGAPGGSSFALDDTVLGTPVPGVVVVTGPPPLQISGIANLGTVVPGASVSATLFAAGGTPPYRFSSLGPLPAGITLTTNGVIGGQPTQPGANSFVVTLTDERGVTVSATEFFSVFAITTSSLPGATASVQYAQTITATGGTPPYSWAVSSGTLPPGLTLNPATGAITGTPTTASGSPFGFSVTAADSAGTVSTAQSFSIPITVIGTVAPVITSVSPSSAPAGSPSVKVTITGTGFVSASIAQWNGLSLVTTYVNSTTLTAQITASDLLNQGTGQITVANPTGPASNSFSFTILPGSSLQFITVAPCRIMDTRNANGPFGGPLIGGGTTRTIPLPSSPCGIPASASAYSLNFTVVPRGALDYLSVWPTGQPQPFVSTLNSPDGSTIANAAIVPAGAAGAINAFAADDTDLVVDINGYFVPPSTSTLQFYPLTPCRVLDTRNPAGVFGGPSIAGGSSRSFPIPSSSCGVPANAAAYAFNVTVVPQGALPYLTAWPTGQAQPLVSTLNSFDGTTLANAAIVPAGTAGAASFYAANTTDLVVDINGYFALPGSGGLNFYTAPPCRLVDTRNATGTFGGPSMGAGTTRAFPLSQGSCGLPGSPVAQAYSLNVTVIPQGVLDYLSIWAAGQAQPFVSTLNGFKGEIVANAAIVPAGGTTGSIDVFVTNPTDVVIDANGYFGP